MSRTIFWDASAFIALGNSRDGLHQSAIDVSQQLAEEKARIVTTSAILTEVANGLSRIGWRSMAERLIEAMISSTEMGVAEIIHIEQKHWFQGWQLYKGRPDKEWGLTDCISFTIMEEKGITESFTADHHFEQAGFICLLKS